MENNEQQCSICTSNETLYQVQEKWVCEKCLHIGIEKLVLPWKESLEQLFKGYNEASYRCLSVDEQAEVNQARIIGVKIRAVLQFLGLPKKHDLLLSIRKMHQLFNKVREADVLIEEMKQKSDDNKVYTKLLKAVSKKQKKLKNLITVEMPAILNDSFHQNVEKFINNELISYVVSIDREIVIRKYEESFIKLVEAYHKSVEETGKASVETIKALNDVRKKSISLAYIYNFLNQSFGDSYQEKEGYYRNLQHKFDEIKDAEVWFEQIKAYGKKINAPKSEIENVKKVFKERYKNLIENVELIEEPIKA